MIIVQTPLRISFFGGGTDFPDYFRSKGGSVLSSAINKYIYVIVKERFDDRIRIGYTKTENVDLVENIRHELIRETLKKVGITKGIEIVTMGDIPAGTGLGSSSAVTVGVLHALYLYKGLKVTTGQLAREACEIEVDILQKPIGYQDQFIAACGGLRFIEFHKNGVVNYDSVEMVPEIRQQLSDRLLLFFTGTTRKSETILAAQKENIQNNLNTLGKLKAMAVVAREELLAGSLDSFGRLLHESWELKKSLAVGISNDGLEEQYQTALAAGALGGKIAGAGGGGFLMLYCPPDKKMSVRSSLSHLRELPFNLEPDGSRVIFNHNSF
jgi:D-glycero-alpha-D-manno-heptose-7-phosphate kinase